MPGLQIGEVARRTGLAIDTIRFYQKQRLVQPIGRSEGGFRLFDAQVIERLGFIRNAQQLGFSLDEIRELLLVQQENVQPCPHTRQLLGEKLAAIQSKLRELRKMEESVQSALRKCDRVLQACPGEQDPVACPVLNQLAHPARK